MAHAFTGLFGAIIIGFVGGLISSAGFAKLLDRLANMHLYDTCGVLNLHGMPAIWSGFVSILIAGIATQDQCTFWWKKETKEHPRLTRLGHHKQTGVRRH